MSFLFWALVIGGVLGLFSSPRQTHYVERGENEYDSDCCSSYDNDSGE